MDAYFRDEAATPDELVDAFHNVDVPIHPSEHITAAALRTDRQRVRQTGRWLVRHSHDRYSTTVGLALLARDWDDGDIPLIQTIGLLSDRFGLLAAEALRRRPAGEVALLWLAQRVAGWGRVYVMEALCQFGAYSSREWLLRNACDGDILDGYFAGKVATIAHLHAAIVGTDVDDDLIDHTGRVLETMADCFGMGMTLASYPPAPLVLAAHAAHLERQAPNVRRYVAAATIVDHLAEKSPEECGCTGNQRDHLVRQYLAVLDRQDWCDAVRVGLDSADDTLVWFTEHVAARRGLRAFSDAADESRQPGQ